MNDRRDQLLFITVPPPRSGNVVKSLRSIPGVTSAAAVYSGLDVVAQLSGEPEVVRAARKAIDGLGAPITDIQVFEVAHILIGPRFHDSTVMLKNACRAYIQCKIDISENTIGYAATTLQTVDCVVAVYFNEQSDVLVLEVLATDKGQFDGVVMSRIQSEWALIRSTRTYLTINDLAWADWVDSLGPAIFISVSSKDNEFATSLKRQIESDTGLHCWKYDEDIRYGEANWPRSVDEAMRVAPLHLYILSEHFLDSGECQREFGQSQRLVRNPEDICGILMPGLDQRDLGTRYGSRNWIVGDRFFAYSRLLDWIYNRLAKTGAAPSSQ